MTAQNFTTLDVNVVLPELEAYLDDEAKDQIGTLLVGIFVGLMSTAARVAVKRQNRWWLNMILFHGAIAAYWWNSCHLNESKTPWLSTIHGGLCWKNSQGQFQQILLWGGDRERWWLNVLVWLAVLANVVPAYATGNEAGRHMTHVKKRKCNPLLNHIIAGILCVCFPYFVVTYKSAILIPVAVAFDIYHQITIHRLIANHDGIWVLRAVSMSLAYTKWIVILNMWSTDPVGMLDQIFILSTGFLGTRAYGAIAVFAFWMGLGDIYTANWYSIGLMTADIMIMGRLWGQMRIAFWLTIVNCAAMHYHQMWKKFLHLRTHFVGLTIILTVIVAHSGAFVSLLFTIVWSFGNFVLPHFNRFRPAPKTLLTPSVTPAFKMIREISGRISTRLGQLSTRFTPRSTRLADSLRSTRSTRSSADRLRRLSQLRQASSTRKGGNGSMSTRSTYYEDGLMSTRSNLNSPSQSIWEGEELQLKSPQINFNLLRTPGRHLQSTWSDSTDPEALERILDPMPRSVPEAPLWKSKGKAPSPPAPVLTKQNQNQSPTAEQFDELKKMIESLQKQIMKNPDLNSSDSEDGKSAPEATPSEKSSDEDVSDRTWNKRHLAVTSTKSRRSRPVTPLWEGPSNDDTELGPIDRIRSAPIPRVLQPAF